MKTQEEKAVVDKALTDAIKRLDDFRSSTKVTLYHRRKLPGGGEYLAAEEVSREALGA